jgi:type IX secretion system PorP/SprF family membrane protein
MGGSYFTCRNSDLKVWDNSDQVFKTDQVSQFLPNAGLGMLLYGRRSYLGVSAPMLISYDPADQYSTTVSGSAFVPRQVRHGYLTGGTVIGLNNDILMKPSVMVRYVENAPLQADFNLNFLFARTLWIGGSYRTNDAVVGIMELQLNRFFRIGYSYDYTLSEIRNYSTGSHEVMIGYDFGSELAKVTTPRFF